MRCGSMVWLANSHATKTSELQYHGTLLHRRTISLPVQVLRMFEDKPLASLGSNKDIVLIEGNRGRSVKLFNNPNHKSQV